MQQWEYHDESAHDKVPIERLNDLGQDGWELVHVAHSSPVQALNTYTFKRPVKFAWWGVWMFPSRNEKFEGYLKYATSGTMHFDTREAAEYVLTYEVIGIPRIEFVMDGQAATVKAEVRQIVPGLIPCTPNAHVCGH